MKRSRLRVNGIGIQIEDHGGHFAPLVFLHFGGGNLRMWDSSIPSFVDGYRCIALDLRGHGNSDAPPTGYHIDDMARDVAGVIRELGIESAHVLGSSIGAEVGLSLAANHAESVRSLVLDGAFCSEFGSYGLRAAASPTEDGEVQAQLQRLRDSEERSFDTLEEAVQVLSEVYREHDLWNPSMEAMIRYGIVEDANGRFVSAWRKWAKDRYMEIYFNLRLEEYYGKLACPAILLTGETPEDDPACYGIMEKLCALAANCRLIQAPGAMHPFGWLLDPKPMVRATRTFLNSVR